MQRHRITPAELRIQWKAWRYLDQVMATMNISALTAIRDEETLKPDRPLIDFKYFNVRPWIHENLVRAFRLGMDQHHYRRVLDIGTGFGYFPYVCEFLDHAAYAIDIPHHRLYDRVTELLMINRRTEPVQAFTPLPPADKGYDYVTAFQIAFNHPNEPGNWDAATWHYFIDDVLTNQLAPGGQLHLELNWSSKRQHWYDTETAAVFRKFGARLHGNEVDIFKR